MKASSTALGLGVLALAFVGASAGSCDGTLLSYWGDEDDKDADFALFFLYLILMLYFFGGVAVTADKFMESIEYITSKTRTTIDSQGRTHTIRVWNETGPGTIVGSAAFNMLMIIAYCMTSEQPLRVEAITVLHFTAGASIFAYIWLYIIVSASSPGEIEIWEAALTTIFFPLFVLVAWLFDTGRISTGAPDWMLDVLPLQRQAKRESRRLGQHVHEHLTEADGIRLDRKAQLRLRRYLRKLRQINPNVNEDILLREAIDAMRGHIQQSDTLRPGVIDMPDKPDERSGRHLASVYAADGVSVHSQSHGPIRGQFSFETDEFYTTNRDATVRIKVRRATSEGEPQIEQPASMLVKIVPGTAKLNFHFAAASGSGNCFKVNFSDKGPEEHEVELRILSPPTYQGTVAFSLQLEAMDEKQALNYKHRICRVEISDKFQFTSVWARITTLAIFADEMVEHNWVEQIRAAIRGDDGDEDANKLVENHLNSNTGDRHLQQTRLELLSSEPESRELEIVPGHAPVAEHRAGGLAPNMVVTEEDGRQVNPPDISFHVPEKTKSRGFVSSLIYVLMLPWNVLFAILTPPGDYFGGWVSFVMSLVYIGFLSAVLGDLATGLGCAIGLKDTVTAITLVALGTSVPDTFASKYAAENDGADPAIGNVTGSNAVNVFLGVGLAWLCGSIYHASQGTTFVVAEGTIAFSVVLFSIFALVWYAVLMLRRGTAAVGGPQSLQGAELGGAQPYRNVTTGLFVGMWLLYIILSALVAYEIIPGF
ncbi:uncharacterized protein MONBRDRAFT_38586 [Monosiga brevicollis MX1]|uniref:Sodium/calcium exchanger membrane region domain-containing protein n=1 Tax=Monosiga brevicollis TaxID=81824 RepID=A9V8X7_MONBE|nr:uncharacterized protein MONBRDRAFT_38586 [Monosiga brevicollis MX1]EDQ85952.1 predicted protein [Monosiga brevicollis MX1]|eukprot:XP_001749146.1 hypothetical protein [Monosiga brevicollis MX1]